MPEDNLETVAGNVSLDQAELYLQNLRSSPKGVDALLDHTNEQLTILFVWSLPFLMKYFADVSGILNPVGCIQMGDQFLKGLGATKVVPVTPPWCALSDATLSGFALLVMGETYEKITGFFKEDGVYNKALQSLCEEVGNELEIEIDKGNTVLDKIGKTLGYKKTALDQIEAATREPEKSQKLIEASAKIQQEHDDKAQELAKGFAKNLKGLLKIRRREHVRPLKQYKSFSKLVQRTFGNFAIIRISGYRSLSKEQKQQRIDALDDIRKDGDATAMKFREGFQETDFFKPFEGTLDEFDTQINQMMESLWDETMCQGAATNISIEDIANISKMIDRVEVDCPEMNITDEQKESLQQKCYTMLQMKTGDFKRRINISQSRESANLLRRGLDVVGKPVRSAGRGLIAQVSKFNPLPNQKSAGKAAFDLLNGSKDPTEKLSQYKTAYKENIESLKRGEQSWGSYKGTFAPSVTSSSPDIKKQ